MHANSTKAFRPYDPVSRLLHWLVVALVAAQFVIGWTMPPIRHAAVPPGTVALHLSIGTALIAAMALRLIWRLTHRPPPSSLPAPVELAAKLGHLGLYLLLIVVPLLGWINASARGWPLTLLGALPYPALVESGSRFGHAMGHLHSVSTWALLALIVLHVVAALFHRLVLKDDVLRRMLP